MPTFESLYRAGLAAGAAGRFDEAKALLREAKELAASDAESALAEMQLAAIPVLLSDLNAELNVFRENLVRRHTPLHVWTALYYLLVAAVDRGDRASADRYVQPLLDMTRELDEPERRLNAYGAVAAAEVLRGNAIAGLEYDAAALAEAEKFDGPDAQPVLAITVHNFVYNCLAASEYRTALEHAPRALALAEELANPVLLRQCLITVAFAYLCSERLDEAEQLAVRAGTIVEGTRLEKYVHYLRGEIARRRGDLAGAAAHFQRLEPLYPEIPNVATILLSMNVAPFLLPE